MFAQLFWHEVVMPFQLDPKISFGHIMQAVIMVVGGMSIWFTTMNRIDNLETFRDDSKAQSALILQELQKQTAANQKNSIELEKLNLTQSYLRERIDERFARERAQ